MNRHYSGIDLITLAIVFVSFFFLKMLSIGGNAEYAKTANFLPTEADVVSIMHRVESLEEEEGYEEAIEECSLALLIIPSSPKSNDSLRAEIYAQLGKFFDKIYLLDEAVICFDKAISARESVFGSEHPSLIRDLEAIGCLLARTKNHTRSKESINRALDIRGKVYGPDNLEIVNGLEPLRKYYIAKGDAIGARNTVEKGNSIIRMHLNTGITPDEILKTVDYDACMQFMGYSPSAEKFFQSVVDSRMKNLGGDHPAVAEALYMLAQYFEINKEYNKCLTMRQRALEIRKRHYGLYNSKTANGFAILGRISRFLSHFEDAEQVFLQALDIYDSLAGYQENHIRSCHRNLAIIYDYQAQYNKAEMHARQALEGVLPGSWLMKSFGAELYNCLGDIYKHLGWYDRSDSMYNESYGIRINSFKGDREPGLGETLRGWGDLYTKMGHYADAEEKLTQALKVREDYYGMNHIFLVYNLVSLADLYNVTHRYNEAESLFVRAYGICEQAYEPNHQHFAWIYHGLGESHRFRGNYAEAESNYLKALNIKGAIFGDDHSNVIPTLMGLAHLYGATGDYVKSLEYYKRLLNARHSFVDKIFEYTTEDQRLKFVQDNELIIQSLYSLALSSQSQDVINAAFEMTLRGKSIVADAAAAEKKITYCFYDDDMRNTSDNRAKILGEISTLTIMAQKAYRPQVYYDRIDSLAAIKDSLELVLTAGCIEFEEQLSGPAVTQDAIAEALPAGFALCDFNYYEAYNFEEVGNDVDKIGVPRYLVFCYSKNGDVNLIDLGPANVIDNLVTELRQQITKNAKFLKLHYNDITEKRFNTLSGRLYQTVFAPLEPFLDEASDILISPDGILNLLPFEIILSPNDRFLIEDYTISYLSCGRDILDPNVPVETYDLATVMAAPDYDLPYTAAVQPVNTTLLNPNNSPSTFRSAEGCLDEYFRILPYAKSEADSLKMILEGIPDIKVNLICGDKATEEYIKTMPQVPRIMHISTHAFVCDPILSDAYRMYDNPYLRMGLAFASANHVIDHTDYISHGREDGILTAFEVSGLNYFGNELTLLSACETGVGDIRRGEGVIGFRRAFLQAGSQSLITSLWKVEDEETSILMEYFYRNWVGGMSKREALRQAALKVMEICGEKHNTRHPYFWGGFVFSGNLD